jgi:hypothetical protein
MKLSQADVFDYLSDDYNEEPNSGQYKSRNRRIKSMRPIMRGDAKKQHKRMIQEDRYAKRDFQYDLD